MTFNRANAFTIDFTVAPYNTTPAQNVAAALVALGHGEFKDVTSTSQPQANVSTYPSGAQGVLTSPTSVGHTVSTGASPAFAPGAGCTAAVVGSLGANDSAGEVTATGVASGMAANTPLVVVTFAAPYNTPPKNVDVEGLNAATAAVLPYVAKSTITKTGFTIEGDVAAAASAALDFTYAVVG